MTPDQVRAARAALGFTQRELGELLGVHLITVSKWERDELAIGPWPAAMLAALAGAKPEAAQEARLLLKSRGVPRAVYRLLSSALARNPGRF